MRANHRRATSARRSGHFSPSWLPSVRFTSVEKRPDRLALAVPTLEGGLAAMSFEEVKRTEGSHDEKDIAASPPAIERRLLTGPDHGRAA